MALFLSKTTNKVDKKGRVSLPAPFRATLSNVSVEGGLSVILFRSPVHACLEGFAPQFMEDISNRLDNFDMFSQNQDDLATAIFGEAIPVSVDETGRMSLNSDLMTHANLNEQATFVGLGQKFQIWSPNEFDKRQMQARQNVKDKNLTLPRVKQGEGEGS